MNPKKDFSTGALSVIGVDIGKETFHIVGLGVDGKIAFRKKVRRFGFEDTFEKLPPSIVGMEACLSAHFVSRVLRRLGHQPRIIPAIYVRPFVKGQKNDYNDAETIAAAPATAAAMNERRVGADSIGVPPCPVPHSILDSCSIVARAEACAIGCR